jgi:chaperonin GroES
MASGHYREIELTQTGDDSEAPRMLLEQHRRIDLDGDGYEEPYIVTVDKQTSEVLRVEPAFSDYEYDGEKITHIEKLTFYVKYEFWPHPKGKFYSMGLGHALAELGGVINTSINQMLDAGHAQIAGGGFISSGLRLQGSGQNSALMFRPREYKVVNASAGSIRDAIYERTFPNPSPIMMSLLQLILGAANDVAAIKDVTSGDASNNGQVGTTLALIEQGLQVFTAIYKRIHRGLRAEFQLIFKNLADYGDEKTVKDYLDVVDTPEADFAKDFGQKDMDIRPVSDPNMVTRLQKMAKAQFLMQTGTNNPNVDQRELITRVFEAADVEDMEKIIPPPVQGQTLRWWRTLIKSQVRLSGIRPKPCYRWQMPTKRKRKLPRSARTLAPRLG